MTVFQFNDAQVECQEVDVEIMGAQHFFETRSVLYALVEGECVMELFTICTPTCEGKCSFVNHVPASSSSVGVPASGFVFMHIPTSCEEIREHTMCCYPQHLKSRLMVLIVNEMF